MVRPTEITPPSRPRLPLTMWLAGVLLTASLALTGWVLYSRGDTARAAAPAAAAGSKSDARVVSFGYYDLSGGATPLYPLQPGRVVKVLAKEGDVVEAGTPLFTLDDESAQDLVKQAKADLAEAEALLRQAKTLPDQHQDQLEGEAKVVEAKEHEAKAARTQADHARALSQAEGHPVSKEEAAAAEEKALGLEAAVAAEKAKQRQLEKADPTIDVTRAEQAVEAKKALLSRAEKGVRECTVTAPAKGEVLRVQVTAGESLGPTPRQPAIMFAPAGPRVVRAEVEQEFAGRLAVGQKATIHDDATTGPTWTGHVSRVSDWFTHRRSMLLEPLQFNDIRTLECIIDLDPDQAPMRIGQRVRVTLEPGG